VRPIAADPTNMGRPYCSEKCKWRQSYNDCHLQKNALRVELGWIIEKDRCGWNLKPGHPGGHPLDYMPCTFKGTKNDQKNKIRSRLPHKPRACNTS